MTTTTYSPLYSYRFEEGLLEKGVILYQYVKEEGEDEWTKIPSNAFIVNSVDMYTFDEKSDGFCCQCVIAHLGDENIGDDEFCTVYCKEFILTHAHVNTHILQNQQYLF
jgi:hypothetical protein